MNRHAYIAELTQLLYYMAPWDRDAAVKKYDALLESSQDPEALMKELGSPMKLAVTLSRGYEPSDPNAPKPEPEVTPEPEEAAEAVAEATEEVPETETDAETADVSETDEPAAEVVETEAEVDVPAEVETAEDAPEEADVDAVETETADAPAEVETEAGTEEQDAPEAVEIEVAEIRSEEASSEAKAAIPESKPSFVPPGGDEIFSEIFSAATQAQSAVAVGNSAGRAKPRPAVLVFYILACILVGVPVTVVLLAVDLMIFLLAAAVLVFGIYILSFFGLSGFPGLGNKLVILGVGILAVTAAIALAWLGVWFMRNATVGFPGFLVRFGREHGYSREGNV
ncbi:MAG: hypothetical protein HFG45_02655 [Oscillospiraceae bacterium]|nr:hypothetical protein [Oscillospiraceae bacterium]